MSGPVTPEALGQLATAIEPRDHGRVIDDKLMRRATRNMLVNALRLCGALGYQAPDLLIDYTDELDGPAR